MAHLALPSLEKLVHLVIKVESQLQRKILLKMLTMMDFTKHLEGQKQISK